MTKTSTKAPQKPHRKPRTAVASPPGPDTPESTLPVLDARTGDVDKPNRFCGKKGRSGPPRENRNAMRHGLLAGKMPADCKYIECRLNKFRRTLEDAIIETKGEVNILDAAAIQTALKWERHGALALRWLRLENKNMKPAERLTFSREIAMASTQRDKALWLLKLDAKPEPLALSAYIEGKVIEGNGK